MTEPVQQGTVRPAAGDPVRLRKIADASRRDDGSDIPLGVELRAAAAEIERLREEVEALSRLVSLQDQTLKEVTGE